LNARDLLDSLRAAGLQVRTAGGHILVSPRPAVTPEQAQAVRENRDAILTELLEEDRADRVAYRLWAGREDPAQAWSVRRDIPVDSPDPEYDRLAAWFLERLPTLPQLGPIRLGVAVTIVDPAKCWVYYADRIREGPRGVLRDEVKFFLRKVKEVLG
jgi:hypothetical protein